MRGGTLTRLLLRALSLAAMGFFFSLGTASAHQGHHQEAPAVTTAGPANETVAAFVQASATVAAAHAALATPIPCSDGEDGGHNGGCCAVACHSAVAALPAGPAAAPDRPGLLLLDRFEPLAGLSGDRMDRPPKHLI